MLGACEAGAFVQSRTSSAGRFYFCTAAVTFLAPRAYCGFVSQIVSRTQIPALVIDYPLAPAAMLPAGPDTALAPWQWLADRGFERIAIVGDSAGSGLTLVTLAELIKKPLCATPVAGVIFSPWVDDTVSNIVVDNPDVITHLSYSAAVWVSSI
jgi:monoterpene epsilon-lactone hydrolase